MAEYAITFARSARRELEKIDPSLARRILITIEELSNEPRPPGCRKLQGSTNLWRVRIGDYRVVYSVDDRHRVIDITAVRHRREAYR